MNAPDLDAMHTAALSWLHEHGGTVPVPPKALYLGPYHIRAWLTLCAAGLLFGRDGCLHLSLAGERWCAERHRCAGRHPSSVEPAAPAAPPVGVTPTVPI